MKRPLLIFGTILAAPLLRAEMFLIDEDFSTYQIGEAPGELGNVEPNKWGLGHQTPRRLGRADFSATVQQGTVVGGYDPGQVLQLVYLHSPERINTGFWRGFDPVSSADYSKVTLELTFRISETFMETSRYAFGLGVSGDGSFKAGDIMRTDTLPCPGGAILWRTTTRHGMVSELRALDGHRNTARFTGEGESLVAGEWYLATIEYNLAEQNFTISLENLSYPNQRFMPRTYDFINETEILDGFGFVSWQSHSDTLLDHEIGHVRVVAAP